MIHQAQCWALGREMKRHEAFSQGVLSLVEIGSMRVPLQAMKKMFYRHLSTCQGTLLKNTV